MPLHSHIAQASPARIARALIMTLGLIGTLTMGVPPLPAAEPDRPPFPAMAAPSPPPAEALIQRKASPALTRILSKRIAVRYERDHPEEVVSDLRRRAGLRTLRMPPALARAFTFSARADLSVHEVLTRLATAGGLELVIDGDHIGLWKNAPAGVLSALARRLDAPRRDERILAVHALARLSDPFIYPLLFRALEDADAAVVACTLHYLRDHPVTMPPVPALPHAVLASLERDSRFERDVKSLREAARLAEPPRFDDAVQIAQLLRHEAQRALPGDTYDEHAMTQALLLLMADADPQARADGAAASSGQAQVPAIADRLVMLLDDPVSRVRAAAAESFAETHDPWVVTLLKPLLRDADAAVREGVARGLGRTRDPDAVTLLLALASDEQSERRQLALTGLRESRDPRAVDVMIAALRDPSRSTPLIQVVKKLAESRDPRVVELLLQIADPRVAHHLPFTEPGIDTWRRFRIAYSAIKSEAISGLAHMGDARGTARLIQHLTSGDWDLQSRAGDALRSSNDPGVEAALLALLPTIDAQLHLAVMSSLPLSLHPHVRDAIEALFTHPDQTVVESPPGVVETRNRLPREFFEDEKFHPDPAALQRPEETSPTPVPERPPAEAGR